MKSLYGRHFSPFLGYLDSVSDQKNPTVHAWNIRKDPENGSRPNPGDFVQAETGFMKEVEYPVIAELFEPQGTYDAGDTKEIDSYGHSGQAGDKPEKVSGSGADGS